MDQHIPIRTSHLFPLLDNLLIDLLTSLTDQEWNAPTVAKRWNVKDVSAHLLDGNVRALSTSRDGFFGEQPANIHSYQDLVNFLNDLNMSWTSATKRLSPRLLIFLLEATGRQYTDHINSLDPFADAIFPVAWAGQETSPNWFHIAREYTEKFLHQQQIRDAVGRPELLTKELFYPFLDTFMYAFPHTFKDVPANNGTTVSLIVTTEIGGQWNIVKTDHGWKLSNTIDRSPEASIKIDPDTAWKLFSKSMTPDQAQKHVVITGDIPLGLHALEIVAVMA